MTTGIAPNAQESFSENPAGQVGAQLALDEAGDGCALITGTGQKTFEILSDDFVKKRALRMVALVFDGLIPERDRGRTGILERETGFAGELRSLSACAAKLRPEPATLSLES